MIQMFLLAYNYGKQTSFRVVSAIVISFFPQKKLISLISFSSQMIGLQSLQILPNSAWDSFRFSLMWSSFFSITSFTVTLRMARRVHYWTMQSFNKRPPHGGCPRRVPSKHSVPANTPEDQSRSKSCKYIPLIDCYYCCILLFLFIKKLTLVLLFYSNYYCLF